MVATGKSSPRSAHVTARSASIAASEMRRCRSGLGSLMRVVPVMPATRRSREQGARSTTSGPARRLFRSCSILGGGRGCVSITSKFWPDVLPVIRAQIAASDGASCGALDRDAQRRTQKMPNANRLAQVPNSRTAEDTELSPLWRCKSVQKAQKFVHAHMLPSGNAAVNTRRLIYRDVSDTANLRPRQTLLRGRLAGNQKARVP